LKINSDDVLGAIDRLLMKHGKTNFTHSSNVGEFAAPHPLDWHKMPSVKPMQTDPDHV
jgi:hypothetical protein